MRKEILIILSIVVLMVGGLLYYYWSRPFTVCCAEPPFKHIVGVYYFHEGVARELDNDICSTNALISLERKIIEDDPKLGAINALFKRPLTPQEIQAGFSSELPHEGFDLLNFEEKDGVAYVTVTEVPGFTGGGSCRIGIIRGQIEKTLLQFPEIKKVVILPEEVLQP